MKFDGTSTLHNEVWVMDDPAITALFDEVARYGDMRVTSLVLNIEDADGTTWTTTFVPHKEH